VAVWCGGGGLTTPVDHNVFFHIVFRKYWAAGMSFLPNVQCQDVDKLISLVIVDDGCRIQWTPAANLSPASFMTLVVIHLPRVLLNR
jgi:hypothetical protein